MEQFDEEFDGIIFPKEKQRIIMDVNEEMILAELMFLTDCYQLNSRAAMAEFVKRIFLCIPLPLNIFVDNYFKNGTVLSLVTPQGTFEITLSVLTEWIGVQRKVPSNFEFMNTTEDFISVTTLSQPSSFCIPIRDELTSISKKVIADTETVALFFTDIISDAHFKRTSAINPNQYMKSQNNALFFDKHKAVLFNPFDELSSTTLRKIELKIGSTKLLCTNDFIETTRKEKLEEIIRIAFGIKNGFINPRGALYNFSESVDPYYFFCLTPIMTVFLNSKTFLDIYHYYEMYEWFDLLPGK